MRLHELDFFYSSMIELYDEGVHGIEVFIVVILYGISGFFPAVSFMLMCEK